MIVTASQGKSNYEQCMNRYEKATDTTRKVIEAFGGLDKFCKTPVLEWKHSFHRGGTGYIDGVEPNDVTSAVMRGKDPCGRSFITLKTKVVEPSDFKGRIGVETVFQRTAGDEITWVSGKHFAQCGLVTSTLDDTSALKQLIENKTVDAFCGSYYGKVRLD